MITFIIGVIVGFVIGSISGIVSLALAGGNKDKEE
jgi:hypothetical protein